MVIPYSDTGKTCLGRGMHCPGACSLHDCVKDASGRAEQCSCLNVAVPAMMISFSCSVIESDETGHHWTLWWTTDRCCCDRHLYGRIHWQLLPSKTRAMRNEDSVHVSYQLIK